MPRRNTTYILVDPQLNGPVSDIGLVIEFIHNTFNDQLCRSFKMSNDSTFCLLHNVISFPPPNYHFHFQEACHDPANVALC
jgi:hypothetical protein